MKLVWFLTSLLITLIAVSSITRAFHKPSFQIGSCYAVNFRTTTYPGDPIGGSGAHELGMFKIVGIFRWNGEDQYKIQLLETKWIKGDPDLVPKYPKSKTFGYAPVRAFDRSMTPISSKFWPVTKQTIECNKIVDSELKHEGLELYR